MQKLGLTCAVLIVQMGAFSAFAEPTSIDVAPSAASFQTPIGFGALSGDESGESQYAVVIEAQNHFKQRLGSSGVRQYGEGEARLELGNDPGVALSATSGISLYGMGDHTIPFSPHIGIEPYSGRIDAFSNSRLSSYYEWLPMASLGAQFGFSGCRLLPLVRAGGAIGSIASPSVISPRLGSAYGAGAYLNCSALDLSVQSTRVSSQGKTFDLAAIDLSYALGRGSWKLGLRGESELARAENSSDAIYTLGGSNDRSEQRIMILLRGRITN